MRTIFCLLLYLAFAVNCMAEKVVVFGTAPSYSGDKIKIMYHSDSFTYKEKQIAEFEVNSDGKFSVEFEIDETRLFFLPLGIYKGFVYTEPGKHYEIKFPPKQELSPAQKLNPFFEAEELMLGIANTNQKELNFLIRKFDDKLDSFINQKFHKIYRKKDQSVGIEFSKQTKKKYTGVKIEFFNEYLKYRLGFLEFLASPNSFLKIEKKYFASKNIQLNNPAYMSLYKKLYGNFLNGYFQQKETTTLSEAFRSDNSYAAISVLMEKYPAYKNSQLRDMIIATSVFDSYTRKFIGWEKALQIYDDIIKSSSNSYNQNLCKEFIAITTHLQKNYPAPNFNINNTQLADYKGKYLYLNFCNTRSYPCLQDFKEIKKLKQQFGQHINFLSIVCDWDEGKCLEFTKNNSYSWKFIPIGDQHHLIQVYKVKAFPSYVLIDPKGNIVRAPAPGPKENIRLEFIKIARDALRKTGK